MNTDQDLPPTLRVGRAVRLPPSRVVWDEFSERVVQLAGQDMVAVRTIGIGFHRVMLSPATLTFTTGEHQSILSSKTSRSCRHTCHPCAQEHRSGCARRDPGAATTSDGGAERRLPRFRDKPLGSCHRSRPERGVVFQLFPDAADIGGRQFRLHERAESRQHGCPIARRPNPSGVMLTVAHFEPTFAAGRTIVGA